MMSLGVYLAGVAVVAVSLAVLSRPRLGSLCGDLPFVLFLAAMWPVLAGLGIVVAGCAMAIVALVMLLFVATCVGYMVTTVVGMAVAMMKGEHE